MLKVLVCGSQTWDKPALINRRIERLPENTLIISGKAKGADQIAEAAAFACGLHCASIKAIWPVYKKRAGYVRNPIMVALEPTFVIAFSWHETGLPTSGTAHTMTLATRQGIPVELHNRNGGIVRYGGSEDFWREFG